MKRALLSFTVLSFLVPHFAEAWNDKTHIAIAYLAYKSLNKNARDRVDEILVLHPLYKQWTKGAKVGQAGLYAFMHAATWPDCIQTPNCPGYVLDGTQDGRVPTSDQEEWQNIGYSDKLMHKYWHFLQRPLVADGISAGDVPQPNLETQLQILVEGLNSNEFDPLKSFDLVWVENLVGELHQPLNCVSRFSAQHPHGDRNGLDVKVRDAGGAQNLHEYWDKVLGSEEGLEPAIKEARAMADLKNQVGFWTAVDIDGWINESVEVAKKRVYTEAVTSQENSGNPVVLDAAYRKAAVQAALQQAALAGNRLALLLNKNLK